MYICFYVYMYVCMSRCTVYAATLRGGPMATTSDEAVGFGIRQEDSRQRKSANNANKSRANIQKESINKSKNQMLNDNLQILQNIWNACSALLCFCWRNLREYVYAVVCQFACRDGMSPQTTMPAKTATKTQIKESKNKLT